MDDTSDRRLTVRRRAAWPAVLASGLAVVGVLAFPPVLAVLADADRSDERDPAVLDVLPDPTGVDRAVEEQTTVSSRRITRVPNAPVADPSPATSTPTSEAPAVTTVPLDIPVPAVPGSSAEQPTQSSPDPSLEPSGGLAVRAVDVPGAVADLVGGEVDDASTWGGHDEVRADFRLDGMATWVSIWRASGPTPYASCRREPGRTRDCHRHADGSAHAEDTTTAPEVDGGATAHHVTWWTVDGWEVITRSSNAPEAKEATPTRPEPGLSIDQLLEVAGSDAWFD